MWNECKLLHWPCCSVCVLRGRVSVKVLDGPVFVQRRGRDQIPRWGGGGGVGGGGELYLTLH